jgi:hypothetical protein
MVAPGDGKNGFVGRIMRDWFKMLGLDAAAAVGRHLGG